MLQLWRRFPGRLKRRAAREWYEYLSHLDPEGEILFLNHGYAGPDADLRLAPEDEPNRYPIQLYHRIAAGADWSGREALEVSCGRGGGASYIARYLAPRALIGLDITASAIEFCRSRHRHPALSFERGDAQRLPFDSGRFDIVLNVEASGSYPDRTAFFREATRVLKPGGHFLFGDYRRRTGAAKLRSQLAEAGLDPVEEADISAGVLRALELDDARKRGLVERHAPRLFRRTFAEFAFVRTGGNDEHAAFARGEKLYLAFAFRKPGG